MLPNYLLAAAEGLPTWQVIGLTALGSTGLFGLLTGVYNRSGKVRDDREAERRKEIDGSAVVRAAEVTAKAQLESKYFDELKNAEAKREADVKQLREEMQNDKRTLGHELREIRHDLTITREVYHQLYNVASILMMQYRALRSRLKKEQGADFDESEFPESDPLSAFNPEKLFRRRLDAASAIKVTMTDADDRKTTGKIEIENQ